MKKQWRGIFAILAATILWGTTFVAQSVGMEHIGPFTFQAIRSAMGALFLIPVVWFFDRIRNDAGSFWKNWTDPVLWKAALPCGTCLFVAAGLQQMGIVDVDAGKSAFLTAMYIVFVPLIGIFQKKKLSKWIPLSVVLCVAGLYFLSCMGVTAIGLSDLLLIGCAVAYAIHISCIDIFVDKVDPIRLNCLSCALCSVYSTIVMFLTETPSAEAIQNCWGSLLYAGILSMGIAYTLQIIGQKHIEASAASLLMSLESVIAVLAGWIVLGDVLSIGESIGCVLIFAAIILSQLPEKVKKNT